MDPAALPRKSFADFFSAVPPGTHVVLPDAAFHPLNDARLHVKVPPIRLFCESDECDGETYFDSGTERIQIGYPTNDYAPSSHDIFLGFTCRHCKRSSKTYAFRIGRLQHTLDCLVWKFGESPAFGPPTPPALLRLLGNERDYYLKGRRAESQGMGVAAFAYYRRVVENRKNDFIDEIIRVAKHLGADEATVKTLETAKQEISFEKSVEVIKPAIPAPLLLRGGHNPMTLLHTALSAGLHNDSDEDCLSLAGDIRNVLIDFVGRAATALQGTAELNSSVTRLLQRQAGKFRTPNADQKPAPEGKV